LVGREALDRWAKAQKYSKRNSGTNAKANIEVSDETENVT
jgi:hypothetical protein